MLPIVGSLFRANAIRFLSAMRPSVSAAVIPMAAVTSRSSLPSSYCDITEQVQRHSTSSRQYSSWSREDFQHFRQRQKQRDSRVLHSRRRRTLGSSSCSSHPYSTAARSPDAQSPTETSAATIISRLEADRNEARRRRTAFSRDRIASDGRLVTGSMAGEDASEFKRSLGVPLTAPAVPLIAEQDLERLVEHIRTARSVTVLTGAGVSTESNIPDYRGARGAYSTGFTPMTHQQFMSTPEARSRYWARSFAGWREFSNVKCNSAHTGLARLQAAGWVGPIITQNVDRLHHQAGSREVIELHGTTHRVVCMGCGEITERQPLQDQMADLNPHMAAYVKSLPEDAARSGQLDRDMPESGARTRRPDGDVELPDGLPRRPDGDVELSHGMRDFRVPPCASCGGFLKPNVVFFGDGLPRDRAKQALDIAAKTDCLLVVGSSLMVFSAFRLAKAAKDRGAAVVLLSVGANRADDLADLKVEALAGEALSRIAAHGSLQVPRIN